MANQVKTAKVLVGLHNTVAVLEDPDNLKDFELMEASPTITPGTYSVTVEILSGGSARWDWKKEFDLKDAAKALHSLQLQNI